MFINAGPRHFFDCPRAVADQPSAELKETLGPVRLSNEMQNDNQTVGYYGASAAWENDDPSGYGREWTGTGGYQMASAFTERLAHPRDFTGHVAGDTPPYGSGQVGIKSEGAPHNQPYGPSTGAFDVNATAYRPGGLSVQMQQSWSSVPVSMAAVHRTPSVAYERHFTSTTPSLANPWTGFHPTNYSINDGHESYQHAYSNPGAPGAVPYGNSAERQPESFGAYTGTTPMTPSSRTNLVTATAPEAGVADEGEPVVWNGRTMPPHGMVVVPEVEVTMPTPRRGGALVLRSVAPNSIQDSNPFVPNSPMGRNHGFASSHNTLTVSPRDVRLVPTPSQLSASDGERSGIGLGLHFDSGSDLDFSSSVRTERKEDSHTEKHNSNKYHHGHHHGAKTSSRKRPARSDSSGSAITNGAASQSQGFPSRKKLPDGPARESHKSRKASKMHQGLAPPPLLRHAHTDGGSRHRTVSASSVPLAPPPAQFGLRPHPQPQQARALGMNPHHQHHGRPNEIGHAAHAHPCRPPPAILPSNGTAFPSNSAHPADAGFHPGVERSLQDKFLIEQRLAGVTYKDIRKAGGFLEAESTLRGRFRTLTKRKDERVRKPEWEEGDLELLKKAVRELGRKGSSSQGSSGKGGSADRSSRTESNSKPAGKIPWKEVAEYIAKHGGSYHFGNATCRKKWDELMKAEGEDSE